MERIVMYDEEILPYYEIICKSCGGMFVGQSADPVNRCPKCHSRYIEKTVTIRNPEYEEGNQMH